MSEAQPSHEDLREARNAARSALNARIAHVKSDLAARGIGGRIADAATQEAKAGLAIAADVASESKGIIAGTVAALALWFLRNPIIAWLDALLSSEDDRSPPEKDETDDRE